MIKCSSSTPSVPCVFPPDFLRQLPNQTLLIPSILKTSAGKTSLYAFSNGRDEHYVLLRIYRPSPTGGKGAEYYHYAGKLTQPQLEFIDQLIAEHRARRIRSGPERLHDSEPYIKDITAIWNEAKPLACYAAALAGFTFRHYALHKHKAQTPPPAQPPPAPTLHKSPYASNDAIFDRLWKILVLIHGTAESNPLKALDEVLYVLDALCGCVEQLLCTAWKFTTYERACAFVEYGKCRPLRKIEVRAATRLDKTRTIRKTINTSQAKIAKAIATKSEAV